MLGIFEFDNGVHSASRLNQEFLWVHDGNMKWIWPFNWSLDRHMIKI